VKKGLMMRWIVLVMLAASGPVIAQSTRPAEGGASADGSATTAPSEAPTADQVLNRMLKPSDTDGSAALRPLASPSDGADGSAAASASGGTDEGGILREGTDVVDRVGRLQKTPDGTQTQFVFDSDARALHDPPMIILPNLKLMSMENAVSEASHDLRFRVTGTVTEYRGHNYILLEKVVVVQDRTQEF
jgi:hypothetical protein